MTCDPRSLGAKCDECPLRQISDPVPSEQNNGSQFIVVGDFPGENEEREGRPFVGPNGNLMQSTFGALGLKRRDANWTNVVLCRPPESDMNRFLEKLRKRNREIVKENIVRTSQHLPALPLVPTPMECCAPRLWNEVMAFDKVMAVGGLATKVIFNNNISVMAVRGSPTELDRFGKTLKVVPTLHPSFVSKNMRWMHVLKNDILRAVKWWNGVSDWKPPTIYYHPKAEELATFLSDPSVPYWTYDVETDGIESLTCNLRCVGIGTPEKVVIVGYDGIQGGRPFYQPHEQARVHEVLKEFFADPKRMKIGHNAGNYDRIVIEQHFGVTPAPLLDTIMLHRLVESELPHNLGFLGSMYTGAPSWKCYDGETEVLTPLGWVPFANLERGAEVAQWDNGTVSFVKPTAYVDQPYVGPMWKLSGQKLDLLVTPDHKMIYKTSTGKSGVCAIQDLPERGSLPNSGFMEGGEDDLSADMVRLIVAAQAYGRWGKGANRGDLTLSLKLKPKIKRLSDLLQRLDIPHLRTSPLRPLTLTRFVLKSGRALNILRKYVDKNNEFSPLILRWSSALRAVFLEELPQWDGVLVPTQYTTTSAVNADLVQAVGAITDTHVRLATYVTGRHKPVHRASLMATQTTRSWTALGPETRETIQVNGRIYCVSVPSGFLLVRRNRKVIVSGNTDREGRKLAFGSETDHELHEYCLFEGTTVITEHGSEPIETLVRNKYAGNVLSQNRRTGGLEWKPVTGWYYSVDKNVQWYKIEVEGQRERDRGLICTHDHKIIGPGGETEAQNVQPGDFIYDAEPQLTDDEVSAVLGTLLGDSILTVSPVFRKKMHEARSASLVGGHAKTSGLAEFKQNELPWLKSTFIPGGQEVVIHGRKGVKDDFTRLDSPNMRQLLELMPLVYDQNGKRRLRVEALDRMGPRGWAWWFMDDGCVQKKGRAEQNTGERGGRMSADETLVIATQSFPREDIDAALDWFRTHFGSAASGKDNVIRLSTIASRTFAAAIAPYVPEIARYKLPKCRDVQFDVPYVPVWRDTKPSLRRVVSAGPHTPVFGGSSESQRTQAFKLQRRYCLDVADNRNFFTTYGLVHNCGLDVSVTAEIVPPLFEQVRLRDQMKLVASDHAIQAVCAEMHRIGMFVDQKDREGREKSLIAEAEEHRTSLRKLVGLEKLNPGSPHQLRDLLFDQWKIEPPVDDELRYTLSGDPSTSDNVLRACLSAPGLTELQLNAIRHIRYYRKAQKLLGTYVSKLRFNSDLAELGWDDDEEYEERETRKQYGEEKKGIVDPRTGRMYPGYNAHVAVTGRLSSSKPINAQNFPSKLRAMVCAAPGHILVGADADQLELRIAASLWKSELYLAALEAGADPHASTALAVFGDKFRHCPGFPGGEWKGDLFIPNGSGKWSVDAKRLRDLAKRVQYASQYAASVETVHRVIAQTETNNDKPTPEYPWPTVLPYLDISMREVRMMHEKWVENAKFDGGWDMEMETYRAYGFLAEPIMGRRRDFLDGENLNEIVNFRIQSSGASIMNKALLQIHDAIPLYKWGMHTGIINQCHDSIVVECPIDGATYDPAKKKWDAPKGSIPWHVKNIIEEAMNQTDSALPGVKITATAEIGMRWNEV